MFQVQESGVGETGRFGPEHSEVELRKGCGRWKVHLNVVAHMRVPRFQPKEMVEKE